jgi:hypothetical protein
MKANDPRPYGSRAAFTTLSSRIMAMQYHAICITYDTLNDTANRYTSITSNNVSDLANKNRTLLQGCSNAPIKMCDLVRFAEYCHKFEYDLIRNLMKVNDEEESQKHRYPAYRRHIEIIICVIDS